MVRAEAFAHCPCSFISQGWVGASRERPEQVRWLAVLQSLQTNDRMLAAIVRLLPEHVILF